MLTLEVYSLAIHYLISIWTTCWWNLNKIVWFELYKKCELFDPKKMVNHFWQSVDAILEDVPVTETIVWCLTNNLKPIIFQGSKNYGSPTRVTRLKFALNMADPISLKGSRTGHSVKVSLWYASLLTNTRFRFLYFRISNC